MEESSDFYDVLVIGGGMVGATLGCCLGGSELRVAVVEDSPPQSFSNEQDFDLRVSALSIGSRTIMEMIGAWQGVTNKRYCPFKRMRVWESSADTEFCSDDINQQALGYIVENRVIQIALLDRLGEFQNVDLLCPAKTLNIQYHSQGSTIHMDDGRVLKCRVLVAADGGQSKVRQSVGIGVSARDYQQHALVIAVETDYSQQDITWQRFTPFGPQAFLPLPGNYASLVWYHSPAEIWRLKSLSNENLLNEVLREFPNCLGQINQVMNKNSFPLKRQHALTYVKEGIALIGDSAHVINPLAGQGVNIGLLDAAALAQTIISAKNKGQDIGGLQVLKQYERARRKENLLMMTTMDLFYQVFSNRILPIKVLRNFGLALAGRLKPAKNLVMRYAIGVEGNLPKLARGEAII